VRAHIRAHPIKGDYSLVLDGGHKTIHRSLHPWSPPEEPVSAPVAHSNRPDQKKKALPCISMAQFAVEP
jgi:hypothetical protein